MSGTVIRSKNVIKDTFLNLLFWYPKDDNYLNPNLFHMSSKKERGEMGGGEQGERKGEQEGGEGEEEGREEMSILINSDNK